MADYPSFMSKTWFTAEDVEELRSGLLNLFRKTGSGAWKSKCDIDMLRLIDTCKSAGNSVQRSNRKNPKRGRPDCKKDDDGKIGDAEVQTDTQATPVEEMHLERGNWCSLKRDDGDLDWDLKLKSTTKGQEWPCRTAYRASSSRTSYHQEKQEWSDNNRDVKVQGTEPSSIFEQVKTSEWIGCTTIDEDKFVNVCYSH
uniref:Uncharacterized protein n=1 Tax=Daucus carota subsp. sativus TaxID=79200 RepID=A0A166AN32_DAUCS